MHPLTTLARTWRTQRFHRMDSSGRYVIRGPLAGWTDQSSPEDAAMLLEWAALLEKVRQAGAGRILDVGGGEGLFAALCRELFGADVVVVDPALTACRRSSELFGIPGLAVDPVNLPFPDAHFDVVTCSGMLPFLAQPGRAVEELARVAKRTLILGLSPIGDLGSGPHEEDLARQGRQSFGFAGHPIRDLLAAIPGAEMQWLSLPVAPLATDSKAVRRLMLEAMAGVGQGDTGRIAVLRFADPRPAVDADPERIVDRLLQPGITPHEIPDRTPIAPLPDWLELRCSLGDGRSVFGTSGDLYTCLACGKDFRRNNGVMDLVCDREPEGIVSPVDSEYSRTLRWEFRAQDSGGADWNAGPDTVPLGAGRFRCNSADPHLTSPLMAMEIGSLAEFRIRMRGRADNGSTSAQVEVFGLLEGTAEFRAENRLAFQTTLDGEWHEHAVPIPPDSGPGRRLARLRLDPLNLPGQVEIDYVELVPTEHSPVASAPRNDQVKVHSHRRSGTHFLMETLRLNFDFEVIKGGHSLYQHVYHDELSFYVFRDGRDVLVSNYHWWRESGESANFGIREHFQDVEFEDFIRGRVDIRVPNQRNIRGCAYLPPDYFDDPIGHWIEHVSGYLGRDNVIRVRYEDLKESPEETVKRIGAKIGIEVGPVRRQEKLTGFYPRKGLVGGWRRYFDDQLLEFFWSRAKSLMQQLGYA